MGHSPGNSDELRPALEDSIQETGLQAAKGSEVFLGACAVRPTGVGVASSIEDGARLGQSFTHGRRPELSPEVWLGVGQRERESSGEGVPGGGHSTEH